MGKIILGISFCLALMCKVYAQSYTDEIVPLIGGIRGNDVTIERSVLLSQDAIFFTSSEYEIVSYAFSYDSDAGLVAYTIKGAKITDNIKQLIKSKDVHVVYFSDFEIKSKNGHPIPALTPIHITIID